jgi:hypothetical protein
MTTLIPLLQKPCGHVDVQPTIQIFGIPAALTCSVCWFCGRNVSMVTPLMSRDAVDEVIRDIPTIEKLALAYRLQYMRGGSLF